MPARRAVERFCRPVVALRSGFSFQEPAEFAVHHGWSCRPSCAVARREHHAATHGRGPDVRAPLVRCTCCGARFNGHRRRKTRWKGAQQPRAVRKFGRHFSALQEKWGGMANFSEQAVDIEAVMVFIQASLRGTQCFAALDGLRSLDNMRFPPGTTR